MYPYTHQKKNKEKIKQKGREKKKESSQEELLVYKGVLGWTCGLDEGVGAWGGLVV